MLALASSLQPVSTALHLVVTAARISLSTVIFCVISNRAVVALGDSSAVTRFSDHRIWLDYTEDYLGRLTKNIRAN